jgi:hypothetical protein
MRWSEVSLKRALYYYAINTAASLLQTKAFPELPFVRVKLSLEQCGVFFQDPRGVPRGGFNIPQVFRSFYWVF